MNTCVLCYCVFGTPNTEGKFEVPVMLRCGHVVGEHCISVWTPACPRCGTTMIYEDCGHRVPLRPAGNILNAQMTRKIIQHRKCLECRVADKEEECGLLSSLRHIADLKEKLQQQQREDTQTPEERLRNIELGAELWWHQERLVYIEQQINSVINEEQSGY